MPSRTTAARALLDAVVVVLTLRIRGIRPLVVARDGGAVTVDPQRSIQASAAVDAALGLLPVFPSCLRRSVLLIRELQRLHLGATLHIGVRTGGEGDAFEAHAWVQSGDVVVNDDPEVTSGYVEIASGDLERLLPLLR